MSSILALIFFLSPAIDQDHAIRIAGNIKKHCTFPKLATVIMYKESSFNINAIRYNTNMTMDKGLMQINTIHGDVPLDYEENIEFGCALLESHYDAYDKCWFGEYHSRTKHLKKRYCRKVWEIYGG